MWIFTRFGFFSVVTAHSTNGEIIAIRSRVRDDLEKLRRLDDDLELAPVHVTADRDYPFRVFVEKDTWVTLAAHLAADVDYRNFKSKVGEESKERAQVYAGIWHHLFDAFAYARPPGGLGHGGNVTAPPARAHLALVPGRRKGVARPRKKR